MKGDRPECPGDSKHRVHKHGSYSRHCSTKFASVKEKIHRYLCTICNWTISVLPENQLPYRSIDATRFILLLNWKFHGGPEPPNIGTEERGCMRWALDCFIRNSPALTGALGQIVKDGCSNARSLWRTLSRLGDVSSILRFLQEKLKPEKTINGGLRGFSLLGRYRCLAVQPLSGV